MPREIAIQQTSVSDLQVIAKEAAESKLFGLDRSQAFTLGLLAEARGLHPVEAFIRYHVIEGRPSMKSEAMQAEFQRMGGLVEWKVSNAKEATAVFRHPKHAPNGFEVSVTIEDMMESGVAMTTDRNGNKYIKKMYKQYPAQMLRARCISQGVRAVDPGVILGCYTPEEISDFDPPAKVINVTPAASQADAIGDELVQQLDAPQTPREQAQRRQEERHPEPRGNPKDRHPAPAAVVEDMKRFEDARPYRAKITELVDAVNNAWRAECEALGYEFEEVTNLFRAENHLASWLVDAGRIKPDYINDDRGKRVPEKVSGLLAGWQRKYPEEFLRCVADYCDAKLKERTDPDPAEPSQEPVTPAEDVSQDVLEEVHGEGDDRVVIERREVAHA